MKKTELMIEYEIKIDSVLNWDAIPIGYAKYLESELIKARGKASAYDRLMSDWETKENLELLAEFPPFEECEDYYDFYDHVVWLCKDHKVCLDDEGNLLDVDLDVMVKALLDVE